MLNIDIRLLDNLCLVTRKKYHTFEIPKRNGSKRQITAPSDDLKDYQKRLLEFITPHAEKTLSEAVHGFRKDRGAVTMIKAAKEFIKGKGRDAAKLTYITADIENFFPSVRRRDVENILETTGIRDKASRRYHAFMLTRDGVLPQGSPASPTIANLKAVELDKALNGFAKSHKGLYLRYADDVVLLIEGMSRERLKTAVLSIISRLGWKAHPDKTKTAYLNSVNGVEILGNRIHTGTRGYKISNGRQYKSKLKRLAELARKLNHDKIVGYRKTKKGETFPIYFSSVIKGYLAYYYGINTRFRFEKTKTGAKWIENRDDATYVAHLQKFMMRV